VEAVLVQPPSELARPGAEFEGGFVWAHEARHGAGQPPMVSEHGVGESQVAPTVPGIGVIGRQRIE
jgi:hypothetical protein